MKHDALMAMGLDALDGYARVLGIDTTGKGTREEKVTAIEDARQRTADVDVLGVTVTVPIRRAHDRSVAGVLAKGRRITDKDAEKVMRAVLGDGQYGMVVDAATDDDGVVDNDALGFAFWQLFGSEQLKNF